MITKTLLILLVLFSTNVRSQNAIDTINAKVAVTVTNTKAKPQKGETVLFISEKNGKQNSCKTDALGKAIITLPAGDIYTIKLKTLTDTTAYSTIDIPALKPGRFYSEPFSVEIEFEPPRSFTLDNVHFDTGKPTLRSESFKELNEIAEYMKSRQEERYEIAGHTDDVGNDTDNLKLSQARANAVRDYLVKKDIKLSRIIAKGYGETKPIADNNSEEGKQKNRRTELVIL